MLDINLYLNSNTIEDIKNYLITQFDNNLNKKIDFLVKQMKIMSSTFRINEYYSHKHLNVLCEYYSYKYWVALSNQKNVIDKQLNQLYNTN